MTEAHTQRPYQAQAIDAVHDAWDAGTRRTLLVMATGTGKTYTFGRILALRRDQGHGRALVLAHRIELIDQAIAALERQGLTAEAESGDRLANVHGSLYGRTDVVVATVQTMRGRRLERWPETAFGTIVVDECFPSGTLVSGRPIETIEVGDVVPCVNHKTGCVTERKVTRLYRSVRRDPLVRLRYGATAIDCTSNHPFFVRGKGYVEANEIAVGDMLCVWTSVFRGDQARAPESVLEGVQVEDLIGDYGAHKPKARRPSDASAQPNAARKRAGAGQRVAESDGARSEDKGRERAPANGSGTDAFGRASMADASGRRNEDGAAVGIPDLLQDRRGQRSAEDRDRNRRTEPFVAEGKSRRCEERGVLVWTRVDGVETVEPASDAGTAVYNFEVAGAHTYFANGALVHNCHHATAQSYREILDRFPLARVLGVTATPDRGDKIGLGGVFDHVSHTYDMRTAIQEGWLCPIRVQALTAGELDLGSIRVTRQEHGRDLNPADVAAQLDTDESLLALGAQIVEAVEKRPTIVFTPSVLMAHRLAGVLTHLGLSTRAIDGTTAKTDRAETLRAYSAREIGAITNCAVLTEGFDAPLTSAVVMLRPTKSRALYAQCIGRGTRTSPGKTDLLVCDLTSNSDDHTLATPLDILGGKPLPDDVRKLAQAAMADGDDVEEAVAKAEEQARKKEELRLAKLAQKAKQRVTAKAKYSTREIDPFREWCAQQGQDAAQQREHNPLALVIDKLLNAGVSVPPNVTREQCEGWERMIAERKRMGLCSIKQGKILKKYGLRWRDVSSREAGGIIDAIKNNGWRATDSVRQAYGV